MLNVEFYNLLMEASSAISGAMVAARSRATEPLAPPPPILQLRGGKAESPGWFLIQAAEFDPEPLTTTNLRVRDIYASERIVQALLELMASEDWFDRKGHGEYHLTQTGREMLKRIWERRYKLLAMLNPATELAHLNQALARLIEASLASPTPQGNWCLSHSRQRAPHAQAPLLAHTQQYFDDFNAFRDDAHMAAWQRHNLSGHVWEAFTLVCDAQANSAKHLFQHLSHRGYTRDEYALALDELVQRGWLTCATPEGAFQTTDTGRNIRARAEQDTDRYFYTPWSSLTADEIAMLHTQLRQLCDGLNHWSQSTIS